MIRRVRDTLLIGLVVLVWGFAGCTVSRNIEQVSRPEEMPPLERLDENLDYEDQNPDQPGQSQPESQ
mgnify:CR=1 FL=1